MKKTLTVIVSVLLVAAMMLSLAGCGAKGKVKATIKDFQNRLKEEKNRLYLQSGRNLDPETAGLAALPL